MDKEYVKKLFNCPYINNDNKHIVQIKFSTNSKNVQSISSELGFMKGIEYVSVNNVKDSIDLTNNELLELTDMERYVNLSAKNKSATIYLTALMDLYGSSEFDKISQVLTNSKITLKFKVSTEKNDIDFYFILDSKNLRLAEPTYM